MPVDVGATVISNKVLTRDFNVLALEASDVATAARPGQFVMLKVTEGTDPLLRRPFSVFQILRDDAGQATGITVLNKRVGRGTGRLFDVAPGARVACLGPLGRPFIAVEPPEEAWMVAGGVGLAPFATLAEALLARGTSTTLYYGARSADELFFVEHFERLGVRVVLATEDGSRGVHGRVTQPLEAALTGGRTAPHIYACGPTPMMSGVARIAAAHPCACDVSLEQVMGCGLGGCYSCVVQVRTDGGGAHFVRSCVGGPVFDSRSIVWDALVH